MVAKVSVVLLESSSSIPKVSLLGIILKSLFVYILFRISSVLYIKATLPDLPHALPFFSHHNLERRKSDVVLKIFY